MFAVPIHSVNEDGTYMEEEEEEFKAFAIYLQSIHGNRFSQQLQ